MIYSIHMPKTKGTRVRSLEILHGAKHQQSSLLVFFCAVLARPKSLWAGASADALKRTGYRVDQTSNPLDTRSPYFEVGKAGISKSLCGNTQMNHCPLTESEAYNLTNYTLDQVRAYRYLHEAHKNILSWSLRDRIYGEMKEITLGLDMLEPTVTAIISHFSEHSENPIRWREKAERLSTVLTQYKDLPPPEPINPEDAISRAETALNNASIGLSERLAQLCDIANDLHNLSNAMAKGKLFDLLDDLDELQADLMGALLVTEGKNDE